MKLEECFKLLGVHPSSSPLEIKQAYRKLARKIHPDNSESSEEKKKAEEEFKRLNTAYVQVLKANEQSKITQKRSKQSSGKKTGSNTTTSFSGSTNRRRNPTIDQIFDDMVKRISTLFYGEFSRYDNRSRSSRLHRSEQKNHGSHDQRQRCNHSPFVVCLRCRQI